MSRFFDNSLPVRQSVAEESHYDDQDASIKERQNAYANWCVKQIPDDCRHRFVIFCMGRMNFYDEEVVVKEICNELEAMRMEAFYYCPTLCKIPATAAS